MVSSPGKKTLNYHTAAIFSISVVAGKDRKWNPLIFSTSRTERIGDQVKCNRGAIS